METITLKKTAVEQEDELKANLKASQGETSMMLRQNKNLRESVEMRDLKNYELKDQIEKAKQRTKFIVEREEKKDDELREMRRRAHKWERSAGAQQRQIVELEKARKVIISQLHDIRSQLEPKDHEIRSLRAKLIELESGLQTSIVNTRELEKDGSSKSKRIGNMSDTVRKQRRQVSERSEN